YVGDNPGYLIRADLNGDGKLDLVTSNYTGNNVSVLLGDGTGSFPAFSTDYPTGTGPESVAAGDINGDGKLDLVTPNVGTTNVSVLLGSGTGTFGAPTSYGLNGGTAPIDVALGDFNGDSRLDIAVLAQSSNNVCILLAKSGGGFQNAVKYPVGATPF